MRFNFNENINNIIDRNTISNFNKVFMLIRPNITNEGDRLKVDHIRNSYLIPITKYQTIKTGQLR
jgi:hypothetical protein